MENENIKLIGAAALGAIGGLLLGSYIWGSKENNQTLSTHLATLSRLLKEIEGIKSDEADELRDRINHILNAIESNYVQAEK